MIHDVASGGATRCRSYGQRTQLSIRQHGHYNPLLTVPHIALKMKNLLPSTKNEFGLC